MAKRYKFVGCYRDEKGRLRPITKRVGSRIRSKRPIIRYGVKKDRAKSLKGENMMEKIEEVREKVIDAILGVYTVDDPEELVRIARHTDDEEKVVSVDALSDGSFAFLEYEGNREELTKEILKDIKQKGVQWAFNVDMTGPYYYFYAHK